ncbi:phosphomannomutase/phosphoglucomutase [candidate division CSSED10-310 bacterium]|uniref:Phosphomannomutase/phosphoglucomutase n=1 Tax=candidate division CSSED10-310 bacterium TaxID=2855610 RepID=A0ABV6Z4J5_UNCC1
MIMDFHPQIFREYDIRGLVDTEITPALAFAIGQAVVQYLHRRGESPGPIVVGHDHRLSSPDLAQAVIQGINKTGWNVRFIGEVPTPVYYFALATMPSKGGLMITASHNPPEYNGFKVNHGPDSLFGPQIKELYEIIQKNDYPQGRGTVSTVELRDKYLRDVLSRLKLHQKMKVVIDAGNGTAGLIAPQLLRDLGCDVFPLFCEPDGNFPNHHPDPTVEANLQDLITAVALHEADLGVAYDGDSDRIGVVDEQGHIIWGDRLLALYAQDLLARQKNAKIIFEVKCSTVLPEIIKQAGGIPIMYRAGHSLIKKKMKEEQALLAGEMSGHMFFAENYYGYDDALYASAKLVEILSRKAAPFSTVMKDIPLYPSTPELRISCPEDKKTDVVSKTKAIFRQKNKIIDIDGVRVIFDQGWGLLRASNTQAILVLRFEAFTKTALKEIIRTFHHELTQFNELDLTPLQAWL